MVIEGIAGIACGIFIREWSRAIFSMLRKKRAPVSAPPPRAVGDIVMHPSCKLPVVLLERLTEGQFRAQYITPNAQACGALLKNDPVDEGVNWLALSVEDRELWSDYPYKLSDGEHANYAKAMLGSAS